MRNFLHFSKRWHMQRTTTGLRRVKRIDMNDVTMVNWRNARAVSFSLTANFSVCELTERHSPP